MRHALYKAAVGKLLFNLLILNLHFCYRMYIVIVKVVSMESFVRMRFRSAGELLLELQVKTVSFLNK